MLVMESIGTKEKKSCPSGQSLSSVQSQTFVLSIFAKLYEKATLI